MLLRKTIHKTRNFFHKTLKNLKSFLFGGYQKLPKAPLLNPPSSSSRNDPTMQQLDNFYRDFSEQWKSDHHEVMQSKKKSIMSAKEVMREENASSGSFINYAEQSVVKNTQVERGRDENKPVTNHEEKIGDSFSQSAKGGHVFAQKMKELEMIDVHDVDHVLDIEEVLHYYSRLTSPVYLDLVDKFFMDMYSEFFLPQPSVSLNRSMRRLRGQCGDLAL